MRFLCRKINTDNVVMGYENVFITDLKVVSISFSEIME